MHATVGISKVDESIAPKSINLVGLAIRSYTKVSLTWVTNAYPTSLILSPYSLYYDCNCFLLNVWMLVFAVAWSVG